MDTYLLKFQLFQLFPFSPLIEYDNKLMETLFIKLLQPHDIFIADNKSITGSGWGFQLHEIPLMIQRIKSF